MAYPNDPPAPSGMTLTSNSLNNGCVLFYPMTEGSGSTIADISGNGYDATGLTGFVPTWATETKGTVAEFVGGQRYMVPQAWWNDNISGGTDLSMSCWVKLDVVLQSSFYGTAIGLMHYDSGGNKFLIEAERPYAYCNLIFAQPSFQQMSVLGRFYASTWYHVVFTSSNGGEMRVYFDGALSSRPYGQGDFAPKTAGTYTNITADSAIGGSANTSTDIRHFEGYQQNIRAWDRVLTPAEVQTLFEDPWAGTSYSPNESSGGGAGVDVLVPANLKPGMVSGGNLKPSLVTSEYTSGTPSVSNQVKPGLLDADGNLKPSLTDSDGNLKPGLTK